MKYSIIHRQTQHCILDICAWLLTMHWQSTGTIISIHPFKIVLKENIELILPAVKQVKQQIPHKCGYINNLLELPCFHSDKNKKDSSIQWGLVPVFAHYVTGCSSRHHAGPTAPLRSAHPQQRLQSLRPIQSDYRRGFSSVRFSWNWAESRQRYESPPSPQVCLPTLPFWLPHEAGPKPPHPDTTPSSLHLFTPVSPLVASISLRVGEFAWQLLTLILTQKHTVQ